MDQSFLQQLASSLPLFDPGRAIDTPGRRYAGYYGIDFSTRAEQFLGRVSVADYDLALQLWRPAQPRATLLILHGYYDHMGLYRHLIEWALDQQFAVLALDLPGHGLSSGERASIGCFLSYQAALDAVFTQAGCWDLPAPWHVLGQSTGAGILVDRLLHGQVPEQLGETILMAPLVRPRQWLLSQMSLRVLGGVVRQLGRRFTENSTDADFLEFVRLRDPLQPTVLPVAWVQALDAWIPRIEQAQRSAYSPLIIQGQDDSTVDWQHNMTVLADKFAEPQWLYLPGARHHLANEQASTRARYLQWLSERLSA